MYNVYKRMNKYVYQLRGVKYSIKNHIFHLTLLAAAILSFSTTNDKSHLKNVWYYI